MTATNSPERIRAGGQQQRDAPPPNGGAGDPVHPARVPVRAAGRIGRPINGAPTIERARAAGARWLVWSTDTNALGFYLSMGGEVIGAELSGITGNEPLTLMRLDLLPA